jgi:citrate lyase subunit beta/citryl-CoA lyase
MTPLSAIDILETARTMLFVPGDRPERFAKAAASGAGLVLLDLEDAVAPEAKPSARKHAEAWLAAGHPCAVRVNGHGSSWHEDDLAAVAGHDCVVVVPKAESPDLLSQVARQVDVGVLALIETAAGVMGVQGIAAAPGVERLALGTFDLGAELGVAPDDEDAMAWSRGALVLASAAAGIAPPVDGVTGDIDDEERLRTEVQRAARMGFTGKLCVHPRQVDVVEALLGPTEEELKWARAVIEAVTNAGAESAVVAVGGRMVDKPVVDRARRMLERHADRRS